MAEPIIGMKYGTYNTLCDQNSKYYLRFKGSTEGCFLIRDGIKTPLADISDFSSILISNN